MNMYTHPNYRGQGICTKILNQLISEVQRLGIHSFELHATFFWEKVYISNGFEKHQEPTLRKYLK